MLKRIIVAALVVTAAVLLVPSVAMANFAIHGNYVEDTDACAGCHRAHSSISTITWEDTSAEKHSALLVSSATTMQEFCYACHDATSQGADTNVEQGIYEGTLYGANGATLNGGGIEEVDGLGATSTHIVSGASWGAYGGGYRGQGATGADGQIPGENQGESQQIAMDCATCHDPHGSANYRILKASVFGNPVGGYVGGGADPDPDGFVSSTETGWPDGGFRLHTAYPAYQPNYTTPMYAKGYNMAAGNTENVNKGMSGWCAGCHATYLGQKQVFTKTTPTGDTTYTAVASVYNAGDGLGLGLRHKHPINTALSNYEGPDAANMRVADNPLPLAHDLNEKGAPANEASDWIECLTCHRAHGTSASMSGWADETAAETHLSDPGYQDFIARQGASDPSALLRRNNRGVCEVCHNK
ncbi:MAG: cytochrome c3 family protein [Coriobacteriales bacterium]|nr:cytochrome c3 family protein [Coriobacteriales bacterium]